MSTIIVITPPVRPQLAKSEPSAAPDTQVRVIVETIGTLADQLRAAASILDGS